MPTRRKNVDLNRIKRSSRRSKFSDYFSSSYVQYLFIFLIWGALLLINQSTEMRFEYFWPGWLFICSIHDSMKYQGLQYTAVFIIIVITVDLICFFMFPASWIYSCGSAYVWVYLLWHTDQGLCFLTLTFCFVFVYFELGFYSREAKLSHSIYLFRPFAAHSIGYPVVCMGFSIKRYLDIRHRKFKKMDVQRQNSLYFRILRDALPASAMTNSTGLAYPSIYLPFDAPDQADANTGSYDADGISNPVPWSVFLLQQLGKSFYSGLCSLTSLRPALVEKECISHGASHTVGNGTLSLIAAGQDSVSAKRPVVNGPDHHTLTTSAGSSNRRHPDASHTSDASSKSKQISNKPSCSRTTKEDPTTRLENSIRRLRTEVQSMRAVESQLRNQLTHLEREDRLNRLCLSDQKEKHDSLVTELAKLAAQCRNERSNLTVVEQNLAEEKRLRQSIEEQITEEIKDEVRSSPVGCPSSSEDSQSIRIEAQGAMDSDRSKSARTITEASCCQRRHALESDVYTARSALRQLDEQIRSLSGSKSRQHQQICRDNSTQSNAKSSISLNGIEHSSSTRKAKSVATSSAQELMEQQNLEHCLQSAKAESERLTNKLRQQNWMKQELLTSYHNSVREINELTKTHKQRDLQILELTMKAEQLECLSLSRSTGADRNRTTRVKRDSFGDKSLCKMSTLGALSFPTSDDAISHVNPASQLSSSAIWGFDNSASSDYFGSSDSPLDRYPSEFKQPLNTILTDASYSSLMHSDRCAPSHSLPSSDYHRQQGFYSSNLTTVEITDHVGPDHCSTSTHFTEAAKHTRANGLGAMQRLSTETH